MLNSLLNRPHIIFLYIMYIKRVLNGMNVEEKKEEETAENFAGKIKHDIKNMKNKNQRQQNKQNQHLLYQDENFLYHISAKDIQQQSQQTKTEAIQHAQQQNNQDVEVMTNSDNLASNTNGFVKVDKIAIKSFNSDSITKNKNSSNAELKDVDDVDDDVVGGNLMIAEVKAKKTELMSSVSITLENHINNAKTMAESENHVDEEEEEAAEETDIKYPIVVVQHNNNNTKGIHSNEIKAYDHADNLTMLNSKTLVTNANDSESETKTDGILIVATTAENHNKKNTEAKKIKIDKFKLIDQMTTTTTKTLKENGKYLMEINEQAFSDAAAAAASSVKGKNSTLELMNMKIQKEEEAVEEEDDDDDENSLEYENSVNAEEITYNMKKLTPQHLLLDELILNDVQVPPVTLANVKNNNNNNNTTNADAEHINIRNLNNYANIKQSSAVVYKITTTTNNNNNINENNNEEHFYMPTPVVSESFDELNKRILINISIATAEKDGSVYTLHVAVPTGRAIEDDANVEQILTHERQHATLNDFAYASPYCLPEPPPAIPDCPFADCILMQQQTENSNNLVESINNNDDNDDNVVVVIENLNENAKIAHNQLTESEIETTTSTTTISTISTNLYLKTHETTTTTPDEHIGVGNFACPDAMPILILEGVLSTLTGTFVT